MHGITVDNNNTRNISDGNTMEWNGDRPLSSVHEIIKRFQQVPDMHNGWQRMRSSRNNEQANLDEYTKCSQNQRVHSQGNITRKLVIS